MKHGLPITCFMWCSIQSRVRKIDTKTRIYIIGINNLDCNNIKTDGKSYENILIYYVGYVTPNSVKPLYLFINKTNGHIEDINGGKYLILIFTDKSKDTLEKCEELWTKFNYDYEKKQNELFILMKTNSMPKAVTKHKSYYEKNKENQRKDQNSTL